MNKQPPPLLIYAMFLLSGCTGLVYEVVWTRRLFLLLGGTTYAITTVLVAFMSGLALGSYLAGRIADRLKQPGRFYGWIEIAIGVYVLAIPVLFELAEPLYRSVYPSVQNSPSVLTAFRFMVGWMVLIVPTTCMGATLPVLVRFVTLLGHSFGKSVGLLYGINTLGAFVGVTLAGFWLLPTFGLSAATWIAACGNLAIGLAAVLLLVRPIGGKRAEIRPEKTGPGRRSAAAALLTIKPGVHRAVLIGFFVSGFSAMVYQIAWTRALVQSLGSSTYAFTCILSAFILGLALGSLAVARWVDRWANPVRMFAVLEIGIALSAVIIVPIHGRVPDIVRSIIAQHHDQYGTMLTWQFLLIIAVTFVPTLMMGAIFPLVTRIMAATSGDSARTVGRAYAINTVGTILGSFLAGFVLIRSSVLGVQNSIVFAAVLNALVGGWLLFRAAGSNQKPAARLVPGAMALAAVFAIGLLGERWNRDKMMSAPYYYYENDASADIKNIKYYAEGVDSTVAAHESGGELVLTVNGKPDASTSLTDLPTQLLLGHIPALLTPDARDVCVIGLGSGITLAAVSQHPHFEHIDSVEISEEVIHAAEFFKPYIHDVLHSDPRVRSVRADGRNHLLLTDQTYDLIISAPSNPWMSGVASLFTREFYQLCEDHLTPNGSLCLWFQGYKMSPATYKIVLRTLFDVFDHVSVWETNRVDYLFFARRTADPIPLDGVMQRFGVPAVREDLYKIGTNHVGKVLGAFITSGRSLREWVADAPVHTDDNALLEFSAPRSLYASEHVGILNALIERQRSAFEELLTADPAAPDQQRIRRQTENAASARRAQLAGMAAFGRGDYSNGLRTMIDGYELDSNNFQLYQMIEETGKLVVQKHAATAATPEMAELLQRIPAMRRPLGSFARGAPLSVIGDELIRRGQAAADGGRWASAGDYARDAYDLNDRNPAAVSLLGTALYQIGELNEAADVLDRYLSFSPADGDINHIRAWVAVKSGDVDKAVACLEKAISGGAVTASAAFADPRFSPIRDDPRFKVVVDQAN